MTLRHMRIFCALCKNDCSTTKTAAALYMTQPAISQTIRELEERYQVKLFDRVGRKLVITNAGKILLDYALQIIELLDEASDKLQATNSHGKLEVGATLTIGSLFFPKYIKAFAEKNPNTEIRGTVATINSIEQKILSFDLDFALSEGVAHDPNITSEEYMNDELYIVAKAGGKYLPNQTLSIDEFKNEKILLADSESRTREIFDRATDRLGFTMIPSIEAISISTLINAALCGIGLAVLPYHTVRKYIKNGELVKINVEGLDLKRKFYIIYRKNKQFTSSAKEFIEFCKNYDIEENFSTYIE